MSNKKPRILFIAPLPPPFAGPENSAKTFLESNVKDYFEIVTFNTNYRKSNAEKGKVGLKMISAFFILNYKLIKLLITKKPKIVYFYVTATILGWIGKDIWIILLSKIFGAKVVIHMRAGHFRTNYDKANVFFKWIIKTVINLNNYNLAQSKSLANQYNSIVNDKSKIGYIYNMIDVEKFSRKDTDDYNKNTILFLGHLSQAKGYNDILKVIPEIVNKFPNIEFCFAGTKKSIERNILYNNRDGAKLKFVDPEIVFNEFIKDRYEKNYKYLGKLDEKEKIEILKKCNFFILPSYSEGFSTAVLEAITSGKPVITTPVGGLVDVITNKQNGLFVEPGSTSELKEAILNLLTDEELRHTIAKNNLEYREIFSIHNIEKKYINFFQDLLDK